MNRRIFLGAMGAIAAGGAITGCHAPQVVTSRKTAVRPRIALIGTEVRKHSHAQHFIDRFLEGYGWGGRWYHPGVDLVSLYIDQFPDGELARERSKRFSVPLYPTIAEALTRGGRTLAVDGVVIIGEHGKYPKNEKKQTLYPRHQFFKEVIAIFEASGRAVPVFMDKHLSTQWNECLEQVADSKRMGFAYLAGSSLPVTWRIPSIDLPPGSALAECVCVCYGGLDSYDFHGYETAQCMSERRRGGEVGVQSAQAMKGAAVCDWLDRHPETQRLVFHALAASHSVRPPPGFTYWVPDGAYLREKSSDFFACTLEHRDGFRTTMLQLNGMVQDFTYAAALRGSDQVIACQMHLPMPYHNSTEANFFNPLVNHIERTIVTNRTPYPVERVLLTSGMTLFGVESIYRGGERIETPELAVSYDAPRESTFWRT